VAFAKLLPPKFDGVPPLHATPIRSLNLALLAFKRTVVFCEFSHLVSLRRTVLPLPSSFKSVHILAMSASPTPVENLHVPAPEAEASAEVTRERTLSPESSRTSSRPASEPLSRDDQKRTRAKYLQAQGFASPKKRISEESVASSNQSKVSERVQQIEQRLQEIPKPEDEGAEIASGSSHQLPRFKLRSSRSSLGDAISNASSISLDHGDATTSQPPEWRFKMRTSFERSRNAEAENWFPARASRTLPRQLESTEGLHASPSSLEPAARERTPRATSLRIRNSRLPAGYTLPHESRPANDGGSSEITEDLLSSFSPLERLINRDLIPDPEDEDADIALPLSFVRPFQSVAPRSGGINSQLTLTGTTPRDSRFSEVAGGESDMAVRPRVPPKSRDRTARNSVLLVNQGSVAVAVPRPVDAPSHEHLAQRAVIETEGELGSWSFCLLSTFLWIASTLLTIFGIWQSLSLSLLCSSNGEQLCTLLTLSFTHNLQMGTELPKTCRLSLPSFQKTNGEAVDFKDQRLTLISHGDGRQQFHIRSHVLFDTKFVENDQLLSNVTYIGVITGDEEDRDAQGLIEKIMGEVTAEQSTEAPKMISAQSVSNDLAASKTTSSKTTSSTGHALLSFWLAGLLTVELTLAMFCLLIPLRLCRPRPRESSVGDQEGQSWQRKILPIAALAFQWLVAGALGSAAASGVLIAFRDQAT
jgi:hypothetical protein